jgi:hypothetical protein
MWCKDKGIKTLMEVEEMDIKPQDSVQILTGHVQALLNENKKLKEQVERMEMMYENTGAIFNRQHMRERIEFLEKELYQQKELTALWKEKYLEENKKLLKMIED